MSRPTIAYIAYDGTRCEFEVPKGANRSLVARAVRKIHDGANPDMATRGLTETERGLLLNIVAKLENHRIPAAV